MTSTTQQINPKSKLGKVTKAAISLTNNTWSLGIAFRDREGLQAELEVAQQNGDLNEQSKVNDKLYANAVDISRTMTLMVLDIKGLVAEMPVTENLAYISRIYNNADYLLALPDDETNISKWMAIIADVLLITDNTFGKTPLGKAVLWGISTLFTTINNALTTSNYALVTQDINKDYLWQIISLGNIAETLNQEFSPIKVALESWIPDGINPWAYDPEHFIGDSKAQSKDDTYSAGSGNDALYGLTGNDELHGGLGNDYIDGGDNNDHLYGEVGNDSLVGGAGEDYLYGRNGNDTLYGGEGDDEYRP